MNQAELTHLMAGLRIKLSKPRKIRNIEGYRGGLEKLRSCVTALVVNERMEYSENIGIVTRQYTERLISDAITHGDRHKHTMEMADWWLQDKGAVHKLFKVLVPRFQDYTTQYTKFFFCPLLYENAQKRRLKRVIVELRGNPFPPLAYSNSVPNKNHIHNVLLAEAKKDYKLSLMNVETLNESSDQ